MRIKGKTAIITGASGKLGSAIVSELARGGCNCICQYHTNSKAAEEIIRKAQESGVRAKVVKADLAEPSAVEALLEESRELGTPRILINNAAVFERSELKKATFQQADKIMNLNFTAAVMLSKLFAGQLTKESANDNGIAGKIVNIVDVGGIRPWAGYVFYCASKAALISATKSLAKELAGNITVSAVAPGLIDMPEYCGKAERERQLKFIPSRRKGKRSEVTSAIRFLLENDYITGEVIRVDGGRSI